MRILMLAQFYPPIIGGEERFVRDLSVELAARGHQVAVVTLWQSGLNEFELDQGVRVYRVKSSLERLNFLHSDAGRKHAPPFPDPEVTWALRRIIAEEKPEIVHGYNWMIHSFLPLKAWSGAKFVLSVCDHSFVCPKKKLIYHDAPCDGPGLTKCLGCAVDHYGPAKGVVTAATNRLSNVFEGLTVDMFLPVSHSVAVVNGIVAKKLPYRVLPNFVADDIAEPHGNFEEYAEQLPQGEFLLYVGAFGRYKGVDVLLQAYTNLNNLPPLVIVGYDTNEYPVRTTNLPETVKVLKNWPNYAVMEAWRRSTVAIVPSVWAEPFGIVVLEAMAAGRAVIASDIGGISDIVLNGKTGLLVAPGNAAKLGEAIKYLMADPNLRTQMGEAGKHRLAEFQASSVVPRYEQVYRELTQTDLAGHRQVIQLPPEYKGTFNTEKELIEK